MQSIAVLPFDNLSVDKKDNYLCDAFALEINHLLSNHKGIRVVSRTSATFINKDSDHQRNVDLLLKGSLFKINEQIRVTVQLIQTRDSTTLKSVKLEERATNLFELIDKMSVQIVDFLDLEVINARTKPVIDSKAYDYYLKGIYHWNLWCENEIKLAIECFNKAVEIEPEFALGYAYLSNCWCLLAAIQNGDIQKNYSNAKSAAIKSIALEDHLPEAYLSLALIKLLNDVDILGAFYALQKAFALNNCSVEAHYYYAFYLLVIGKYKMAVENIEYVLKHDPFNIQVNSTYGFALSLLGAFEEAEQQLKKTLSLAPDSKATHDALAWTYLMSNQLQKAKDLIEKNESGIIHSPATQIALYHQLGLNNEVKQWMHRLTERMEGAEAGSYYREASIAYLSLGDMEKGADYFERFYHEKIGFIMTLTHPAWKSFRAGQKFYKYKKRLKLINPPLLSAEVPKTNDDLIVINSSTAEELLVSLKDLLFIESQNIYSRVVWASGGKLQQKLLRISLSKILDQSINPSLFRCHNSYIINTRIPFSVSGNRKSMLLNPVGYSMKIPVSRAKAASIHEHLNCVNLATRQA